MAADGRPPITCHVLDTVKGIPAASIPVTLKLLKPAPSEEVSWGSMTSPDGRVTSWEVKAGGRELQDIFDSARGASSETGLSITWVLQFDVGAYFKGEGFWEDVDIKFKTQIGGAAGDRSHWHVPLLLSPWSYTTYRGS